MTAARGQLLIYYVDPGEAAATSRRLRAAGIAVEVASVDPHNIQPSRSGTQRVGVWVVFDDQFEDAVQLLQNPHHVPRRIIRPDVSDSSVHGAQPGPVRTYLVIATIIVLGLGALVYLV